MVLWKDENKLLPDDCSGAWYRQPRRVGSNPHQDRSEVIAPDTVLGAPPKSVGRRLVNQFLIARGPELLK